MSGAFDLCGVPLRGPVLNGSGTFDAIAARRTFGDRLLEEFPFDAFVSKTITIEPRQGNPPPRLWESPAGLINSIGLPNKGLSGFLSGDLPQLARREQPPPAFVNASSSPLVRLRLTARPYPLLANHAREPVQALLVDQAAEHDLAASG